MRLNNSKKDEDRIGQNRVGLDKKKADRSLVDRLGSFGIGRLQTGGDRDLGQMVGQGSQGSSQGSWAWLGTRAEHVDSVS